jgi:hypothetical protein
VRSLRLNVRFALRSRQRFPTLGYTAANLRGAWRRSDPARLERWQPRVPSAEDIARWEASKREREQTRARRLIEGPAVYTGRVETRPAWRGVTLLDLPRQDDVHDWVCDALGLDGYGADSVRARITVELLADEEAPPPDGLSDEGDGDGDE